jgi:hypothetical protein
MAWRSIHTTCDRNAANPARIVNANPDANGAHQQGQEKA